MLHHRCKLFILVFFAYTIFSCRSINAEDTQAVPEKPKDSPETSLYALVEWANLASLPEWRDSWWCDDFKEYLERYLKEQLEPLPREKRWRAFNLMKHGNPIIIEPTSIPTDPATWHDLAFFCGENTSKENYVAAQLARTQTEIGTIAWLQLLAQTTTDTNELMRRQNIIKQLIKDEQGATELREALAQIALHENCILSYYNEPDNLQFNARDFLYFKFGGEKIKDVLNSYNGTLTAQRFYDYWLNVHSLAFTIASGCILTAYGIACLANLDAKDSMTDTASRYRYSPLTNWLWSLRANNNTKRIVHAVLALGGATMSWLSLPRQITWARDLFLLEQTIYRKLTMTSTFMKALQSLACYTTAHPQLKQLLPELSALEDLFNPEKTSAELGDFVSLMQDELFDEEKTLILNRGKMIRGYGLLHKIKDQLAAALRAVAILDAYCGAAKLVSAQSEHFCFVDYVQASTPQLTLKNFFNPMISPTSAIKNSIAIGNDAPLTSIVTGPNAGGKSTLIKAIAVNVLLAQSIGIAAAQQMSLTPFSYIATYVNITDNIAKGNSLFKAEVLRTLALVDRVEKTVPGTFNFVIFDEMFNGTTPAEGSAAAHSVTEHIGRFNNTIALVATHFEQLTELEPLNPALFKNYKVSVSIAPDGGINYPFKLEQGSSTQHIALDILRNEGFKSKVLDDATRMIRG